MEQIIVELECASKKLLRCIQDYKILSEKLITAQSFANKMKMENPEIKETLKKMQKRTDAAFDDVIAAQYYIGSLR